MFLCKFRESHEDLRCFCTSRLALFALLLCFQARRRDATHSDIFKQVGPVFLSSRTQWLRRDVPREYLHAERHVNSLKPWTQQRYPTCLHDSTDQEGLAGYVMLLKHIPHITAGAIHSILVLMTSCMQCILYCKCLAEWALITENEPLQ